MEPGVTLFNAFNLDDNGRGNDEFGGVLYMVDHSGDVVWFFRSSRDIGDARRLSNGNLMIESNFSGGVFEIDMLGNIVQYWDPTGVDLGEPPEDATPVATDSLHHDVYEMAPGQFLSLSSEMRMVDKFPTSEEDPDAEQGAAAVIGDIIVEFERDGTIVREYRLLDILDPNRIGYNSLGGGFWKDHYEPLIEDIEATPIRDWSHANAIIYDESDDSYIVSVRHQDVVIKVSRETGELLWMLGPPEHWEEPWSNKRLQPVGDLQWQYHEHGPVLTGAGTILMFDNGTNRAGAFQDKTPLEELNSRVVEFAVDAEAMEVRQVWTWGGPDDELFYSSFVSDADWLPVTGNVLVTDGARETDDNGVNAERGEGTNYWARIVEVTHTEPAEKVFELNVKEGGNGNWHVYRAERLPSLYP
jgi:arylsulfate sulfotransferase